MAERRGGSVGAISITGLREFRAQLRAIDATAPRQIRVVGNEAAQKIVDRSKPRVPTRSGRARKSIRAGSTQSGAKVKEGGARTPYMGWLDFGGPKRKSRPARRPFYPDGRFIWRAYGELRPEIERDLQEGLARLARDAGLGVS